MICQREQLQDQATEEVKEKEPLGVDEETEIPVLVRPAVREKARAADVEKERTDEHRNA